MAIVYETDIRTLSRSEDLFVRYEASCKGLVDISVKILLRLYGETVSYDKLFQSVNEAISMIDDVDPSISIQVLQLVSRSLTEHKKYRST